MTLGELIAALEFEDPRKVVPIGFGEPHSWRGDYCELAFDPAQNVTIDSMLAHARSAAGSTYQGWKGGHYTMSMESDCYLAAPRDLGETLGPTLLRLMLTAGTVPADPAAPAARILDTDPRALALARARQQLAHNGTGYVPPWDDLTDDERATALPEARNWLQAASDAGLLPAEQPTSTTGRLTVYASIGNSDDKLTQMEWAAYASTFVGAVKHWAGPIHGIWYSVPDSPYQNMAACFEITQAQAPRLKDVLATMAKVYRQDSIAWAVVSSTEFIPPGAASEAVDRA